MTFAWRRYIFDEDFFFDPSPFKSLHDECNTFRPFYNDLLEFVMSLHDICETSINYDGKFLTRGSVVCSAAMKSLFANVFIIM